MIKSNLKARRTLAAIAVGTALMLSAPSVMAADNTNGTLKGIITSDAGTQVSGATITVKHQTKGISRTVTSNSEGKYNLRGLPIGRYTVTI
ncbi:MAG: carboxypeptidase regulatory-like domain-containing protein, partial [Colwellia sp.]|uniref:carboxypeptidase-like regulatory domain-containing protein n=1 Tax=Colwellia sp. TaxID=56799 RepID=UPI001DBA0F7B